jgi:putative component of toxin-antitoxin plasmid stabilization module
MINNYKAKMAILQRVLERLEETNHGDDNSKQSNGIKNI